MLTHSFFARIYIKKVRKFPEFSVDSEMDKKQLKAAMDDAFHSLKESNVEKMGEDRLLSSFVCFLRNRQITIKSYLSILSNVTIGRTPIFLAALQQSLSSSNVLVSGGGS